LSKKNRQKKRSVAVLSARLNGCLFFGGENQCVL
jgi:hypothetical protein